MSSTTATAACTFCRELRDPAELLLVHVGGRPTYAVCRPSRSPLCFRAVTRSRADEPIELLSSYLARKETSA